MDPKLRPKNRAEEIALFRSEVIGALVRRELSRGELTESLRTLSQARFRPPGAKRTRTFSTVTLRRWYDAYRKRGLQGLMPTPRRDRGHGRALTAAQRDLICEIRRQNPRASADLILRTLVTDGRLEHRVVSGATLRRLFRERGLDRISLGNQVTRPRRRWQAEHPNALWHGDVCHGPSLHTPAGKKPLRIHALMDDASRYATAIGAYHSEREEDMLDLWLGALRRHGRSDALYLDNGSTYRGNALRLACERLGTTLLHAKPYDAPARGKMERFWRTLRQGCLDFVGTLGSLHDINVRLFAFIDEHYHQAPHGGLMGRTPGEVWGRFQRQRPPDDLDEDTLREALTVRERRRVRKDSTLSIDGIVWELEASFLAGHLVTVGRTLLGDDSLPWVEHEDRRLPLHPVDPIKNARRRRTSPPSQPSPTIPFDPPGALLDRAVGRTPRKRDHEQGDSK